MAKSEAVVAIRPASAADANGVAALADELRATVGGPLGHLTAEAIRRDGFGTKAEFQIIVAEQGGRIVGYALYHDAYEPAYAARGIYLADLMVAADMRRRAIGRRLFGAVADEARRRDRTFLWWVAQSANAEALVFYRALSPEHCDPVIAHALLVERLSTAPSSR